MGLQLTTENGYSLLEAVSALQKTIRRGLHEEAFFWAAEIEARYAKYLWRRLVAIVNEDIGLASPETIVLVEILRAQYWLLKEESKGPSERMVLANAIVAMCRAPKTRLGDDLQTVIYRRRIFGGWRLVIPDYAKDKHTGAGRQMGRGWEHWITEGCRLSGEVHGLNPYADEANRLRAEYGKMPPKAIQGKGKRGQADDEAEAGETAEQLAL